MQRLQNAHEVRRQNCGAQQAGYSQIHDQAEFGPEFNMQVHQNIMNFENVQNIQDLVDEQQFDTEQMHLRQLQQELHEQQTAKQMHQRQLQQGLHEQHAADHMHQGQLQQELNVIQSQQEE